MPRCISLSACGTSLAVGHSACVRTFSVAAKCADTVESDAVFNLTLTCLRKVALGFSPDYLLSLPIRNEIGDASSSLIPLRSNIRICQRVSPQVLACSHNGTVALMPGQAKEDGGCLHLSSAPFAAPVGRIGGKPSVSLALCPSSRILSIACKGKLFFYHSVSGVTVMMYFICTYSSCDLSDYTVCGSFQLLGAQRVSKPALRPNLPQMVA